MYLHKIRNSKTNRTSLLLRISYRDDNGKPRNKTIKNYGILEDLIKKDSNALEKIEDEIEELKLIEEKKRGFKSLIDYFNSLDSFESYSRNYGYLVYEKVFNDLKLDAFFKRNNSGKSNLSDTVLLQIISRLLNPNSKLKTFNNKDKYLKEFQDVELHQVYKSLDVLSENEDKLLKYLNTNINKITKRESVNLAFYDVTTYAFESQDADTLRNFGYSKDKKFNEVQVVMGLLIDENGLPLGYELFAGNNGEFSTLKVALEKMVKTHDVKKVIVTADRGLNSRKNLQMIKQMGFDYVVATKLGVLRKNIQKQIIDSNWDSVVKEDDEVRKIKSIDYINESKKEKICLDEKMVITYSQKRANKDKKDRMRTLEKIEERFGKGKIGKKKLQQILKKMGKNYFKITGGENLKIEIDKEKIKEKEKLDGYYAIQTSKKDLKSEEICGIYKNLWKIEESFRIMKSNLEFRPVYHWTEPRIKGHFLMCYIAFAINRIIEYKLRELNIPYSTNKIIEALKEAMLTVQDDKLEKVYIITKEKGEDLRDKIFEVILGKKIDKKFYAEEEFIKYFM